MKLFELSRGNLADLVYHSILVFLFQAVLSYNIFQEVFDQVITTQKEHAEKSDSKVYIAKFITSMAMHLSIFGGFDQGR